MLLKPSTFSARTSVRLPAGLLGVLALAGLLSPGSAGAATIAAAKLTPAPQSVTITNAIVTDMTDTTQSTGSWVYYIHDATGGCAVIASTANVQSQKNGPDGLPNTADDLRPGSVINITGTSVIFNGGFQVGEIPVAHTLTYGGFSSTPVPTAVSTTDLLDFSPTAPALVGKLVKLSSVTFLTSGNFSGATIYSVTDGTNIVDVRIPTTSINLVGMPIPTSPVNISGTLTVFDAAAGSTTLGTKDFQLLLTSASSLVVVPEPVSFSLLGGCAMLIGGRRRRN